MKEKEGKEEEEANNVLEDLVVQGGDVNSARSSRIYGITSNPVKPKNPRGKKSRTKEAIAEEVEEDEEEERLDEVMRKRKSGGCINKQEAATFQNFMSDMMELVEQMCNDKNLVQPVWEVIRSLKLEYDKLRLFKNNGAANVEEIVETIHDTKGTA